MIVKCSCLCGQVKFSVKHDGGAVSCHCGQCRKQSGHYWASGQGQVDDFEISGEVSWYAASDLAKRGFCGTCGSFLFWKHNDEDKMSFSLGTIDGASDLTLQKHIFVADKGDYYDLADGLPQLQQ